MHSVMVWLRRLHYYTTARGTSSLKSTPIKTVNLTLGPLPSHRRPARPPRALVLAAPGGQEATLPVKVWVLGPSVRREPRRLLGPLVQRELMHSLVVGLRRLHCSAPGQAALPERVFN